MATSSSVQAPSVAASESAAAARKVRADAGDTGATTATGFSQLLQAAGQPEGDGHLAALTELSKEALEASSEEDVSALGAGVQVSPEAAWMSGELAASIHSLVGQTARLDQAADTALRDGSHLQARQEAGDPLGLTRMVRQSHALRGDTPVVAQGVAEGLQAAAPAMASVAAAGASLVAQGTGVVQTVVDAMADMAAAVSEDSTRSERQSEGRVSLQGQWVSAERTQPPAEAMQRLLGQMGQFLSASGMTDAVGGKRRGAAGGADDGFTAGVGEGVGLHPGQGAARLTENAVSQAAANQQAGNAADAQAEPEMAFWMNARQQRAEMVLDRDGEPVRVQVSLQGNEAHVTFRSDTEATRSMLDASVAQLRDMLAAQGMELAGVQVQAQAGDARGQDGPSQSDGFMPAGARRVRLQAADAAGMGGDMPRAAGQGTARGVDVFA